MKTIETFSKPEEAHILRMRLESVGISAFVQDEYLVQMDWAYSNAIGGVRVQVADEDLEDAMEFLAADTEQNLPDAVTVVCPVCGSQRTAPDDLPRRIALVGLVLLNFPLPFARHQWRCKDCNHLFQAEPAKVTAPE